MTADKNIKVIEINAATDESRDKQGERQPGNQTFKVAKTIISLINKPWSYGGAVHSLY